MKVMLIALALLGGCSVGYASPDGNLYPPECQRDLTGVKATVFYGSSEAMARFQRDSRRVWAITIFGDVILMDASMRGAFHDAALHHERCHVLMGKWHG